MDEIWSFTDQTSSLDFVVVKKKGPDADSCILRKS